MHRVEWKERSAFKKKLEMVNNFFIMLVFVKNKKNYFENFFNILLNI